MSRILSGIRTSGTIHLGIYIGAMKQWVSLQDKHEVYYMVGDLHGITTPYDPKELPNTVRQTVLDFLAAGLDPEKAVLFVQSHVPAHSELMWLLNTFTPMGELGRMVQFKEKSAKHPDHVNAGIFNYPILMAADILAYKADAVPVGDDQDQHVEFSRIIARKFNRLYGETFPEPKSMLTSGKRIMSLVDPEVKMSKSDGNGINLNDDPETILAKLKKAVTSSEPKVIRDAFRSAESGDRKEASAWRGDPNLLKQYRGVRNLFAILLELGTASEIGKWRTTADTGELKFSEFKPDLSRIIADHLAPFRERRQKYERDQATVNEILAEGAKRANVVASATLAEVQQKMGLR